MKDSISAFTPRLTYYLLALTARRVAAFRSGKRHVMPFYGAGLWVLELLIDDMALGGLVVYRPTTIAPSFRWVMQTCSECVRSVFRAHLIEC